MGRSKKTVRCINTDVLPGKEEKPKLVINQEYPLVKVLRDSQGNPHLDVGLISNLNFVTSHETGEKLENGHLIHWCHPSRFEVVE